MAKKFTKEELEQDPLLNSYAKIQTFYFENKTVILSSGIAIILAIGLAIGYNYYQKAQNEEALRLMGAAQNYFRQGNFEQALQGSAEDFTIGFEQIINEYSRTQAGNLAYYYAAVSEFNLGNTDQALAYIDEYEAPDGILGVAPISFHATLLTETENFDDAAELYVKAAEWDINDSTSPYNYLEAARTYHEAGNAGEAIEYVQLILDEYPNSGQQAEANKLLGLLRATTEQGINQE